MTIKDFIPPLFFKIKNRLTEDSHIRKNRLARHNFLHSYWKSHAGFEHEDLLIDYLLGFKEKGAYIEVGASDPVEALSITTRFYKRGWRGINIEPCTMEFKAVEKHRKGGINLNICIGKESGTMPFYELEGNSVGSSLNLEQAKRSKGRIIKKEIEVLSLRDLCAKYPLPEIDFIVIDVEGFELKVLQGNDWVQYRPKVMVIETVQQDYLEIVDYLKEKGYILIYNNYLNSIFIDKNKFPIS